MFEDDFIIRYIALYLERLDDIWAGRGGHWEEISQLMKNIDYRLYIIDIRL